MEMKGNGKNAKKKGFKLTRQLIRLAINDGWTQADIADRCRTHQSVVSAWYKGRDLAKEHQIRPLLEIYGHKIRRNSFRVYWDIDSETSEKKFYRVEGKVILAEAFYDARRDSSGKLKKKIPVHKLVIHHQGNNQFRVVQQSRLYFKNSSDELESSVADAVWGSQVHQEQFTTVDLVKFVDRYAKDTLGAFPSDANMLPFILRQALLQHGFEVDGVVDYPAFW
jgi:transcriptional regulator with XRE-family HTH domain